MHIIGYLATLMIGLSLGLMGAGGSILTLPVLVYLFRIEASFAVRNSLFIVGCTSAVCSFMKFKMGEVLIKKGLIFASISILVVWFIRRYIIGIIPATLFRGNGLVVTFESLSMVIFSLLMIIAARSMISVKRNCMNKETGQSKPRSVLIACALATGVLTRFLGAGGGFMIVPALVIFFELDMKKAIGTSLFIISLNTLSGFLTDIDPGQVNWPFLITITALAILGAFLGQQISKLFNTSVLKKCFGWFILLLSIAILITQAKEITGC